MISQLIINALITYTIQILKSNSRLSYLFKFFIKRLKGLQVAFLDTKNQLLIRKISAPIRKTCNFSKCYGSFLDKEQKMGFGWA